MISKSKYITPVTNLLLFLSAFLLTDPLYAFADDFSKFAEKYKNSIVKVFTVSNQGSGFFIKGTGHIVTCLSLIKEADQIMVMTTESNIYAAKKIRENPERNIALLQISEAENHIIVELGDTSNIEVGNWVMCGGHLNQKGTSFTVGVVLTRNSYFIQTDAAAPKDYDGGPMFDQTGKVIGVIGAGYENQNGIRCGIAIPVDFLKPVIEPSNK